MLKLFIVNSNLFTLQSVLCFSLIIIINEKAGDEGTQVFIVQTTKCPI